MQYYHNPVDIFFGRGTRQKLINDLSDKLNLVVTSQRGRRQMIDDPILKSFALNKKNIWIDNIQTNPDLNFLQNIIDSLSSCKFDFVIGFGGGSVLDSAKALSVALGQSNKPVQLIDLIRNTKKINMISPIPMYALPTTAGTGSEVTPFATVWDNASFKKYSLAGNSVYPFKAIVDPDLVIKDQRNEIAISTALDALNQAAESIWNNNMTPISEMIASNAIKKSVANIGSIEHNSIKIDALSEAALLGGLAISQTRTALCHSISYPLTARFGVPHGYACAFTMPAVLELNMSTNDMRFERLEKFLGVDNIQALFHNIYEELDVNASVKKYVPSLDEIYKFIDEMYTPDRANNNLVPVDSKVIKKILKASW
jgi:alcohol dehydrogenase